MLAKFSLLFSEVEKSSGFAAFQRAFIFKLKKQKEDK